MANVLDPQGVVRDIPNNMVNDAVQAGGKPVSRVQAPDKTLRWIPHDQLDAAQQAGGLLIPDLNAKPNVQMQPSYTDMAIQNSPSGADPHNPGNMPEQIIQQQAPEDQAKTRAGLAATAGITAGGTVVTQIAPELYDLAVKHLAGNVLPGMEEEAAKAKLLEYAPKIAAAAKDLGIGAGTIGLLWKAVFGGKGK